MLDITESGNISSSTDTTADSTTTSEDTTTTNTTTDTTGGGGKGKGPGGGGKSSDGGSTEDSTGTITTDSGTTTDGGDTLSSTADSTTETTTATTTDTTSETTTSSDTTSSTVTTSTTTTTTSESEPEPAPETTTQAGVNITGTEGTFLNGQTATINGTGFSDKTRDKPYFYWKADLGGPAGSAPSSFGFIQSWNANFGGELTQAITAPNSQYAIRLDHSATSGAILSSVKLETPKFYMWRRSYNDFTQLGAQAISTRYINLLGQALQPGQVIRGVSSGATGILQRVESSGGHDAIFYEPQGGTINADPPVIFQPTEELRSYDPADTGFTSPLATMQNNTGGGLYRNFNNKIFRMWSHRGNAATQRSFYAAHLDRINEMIIESSGTDSQQFINQEDVTKPFVWTIQELYFQSSTLNTSDGIVQYSQDGILIPSKLWKTRNSTFPDEYDEIFQMQVSNGANRSSWRYFDALYIEDSWHHILLCSSPEFTVCFDGEIQIPTFWSDTKITIRVNTGSLDINSPMYLYVIDGENKVNNIGYLVN
jgi:hypothetical protein